jgi:membrane protein implicated in regulation of membrane protease activity
MNKRKWSRQIVLRYLLLQLPGLAMLILILILLQKWVNLPIWTIWTFISLWVIKDVILYFFVWRAYDTGDSNPVTGSKGIAVGRLSPSGYVRIHSELWQAKVNENNSVIEKGEMVTVKGLDGLTLIVQSDKREKA